LIGSTVSHYQILDRLGSGGMGVVYKAVDVKLDRLVALKFLAHQRGASEEARRRFIREAKAASAFDHPNVCTVYEIDETPDGALFIAMALCEGEALRDRIARGPLPLPEAIGIAGQIAAGLARAHERGIVHRDLKPANVMVTPDGRVKIVDFGIAKLADQSRITRAGVAVGTAAYMSPEQVQGEDADPRTDIWSLGVMIYEMVTGRVPFTGGSETELLLAIITQTPSPMAALRPGVPPALERTVKQALAKHPDARYPSMDALGTVLRGLAPGPAEPPAPDEDDTLLEILIPSLRAGPVETVEGPGSKVDRYEILELLGGGGMGVVYKARDTRLSRIVALKFLPPELTRDPRAKERFEQEARAASSLDHPNLCTILELGDAPDGRLYLVMPCYDGETLRRKIERGPLPVDQALDIACQIARGLAKAHHNGIVHRDVKPANLIVTGDGVVKILDFGLAKLAGIAAVSHIGSSAGTPAYMSPEQARGDEVDERTDLWSLGVVLYEMLTGRRPFRGEREQAVIYALLHERPQPLRELRPEAPPELARIVERLLAKAPEDRYASIEEPLAELRALIGATGTTGVPVLAAPRRRTGLRLGAAAAIVALTAAIYLLARGRSDRPLQMSFAQLTDQEGSENFPSLSPDGNLFAFVRELSPGNHDIFLQRVGGNNPVDLTADSPQDDTQPAFSPDGKQIAFRSERDGGGIFLMGATGESVRRLTDFGYNPAWSPDGKEIAVATEGVSDPRVRGTSSRIWRVDVNTGERHPVPVQGDAVQPSWSPSGDRLAYWGVFRPGSHRVIWTVPARGGRAIRVTDDAHVNWSPVWSPDRRYLYFSSDRGGSMNLWRVPIAESTGEVRGAPEPVTTPAPWSSLLSFSRDGRRAIYATLYGRANIERAPLDPALPSVTGPLSPITQGSRQAGYFRVSPDGRRVVLYAASPQEDLFVAATDGTGLRQLTDDVYKDRNPSWSPDGRQILFYSDRSGRYEAWTIRPDGGDLQPLTRTRGEPILYPVWSPDSRRLVCGLGFSGPALIDLARPIDRRVPERLPAAPAGGPFFASSWSPDGRWLAGDVSDEGVFLFSFASRRYERIAPRGSQPVWWKDGRRLLYVDGGIQVYDTRTKGSRLLLAPPASSSFLVADLSPDNRTLYVLRKRDEGDIWVLTTK
jgi:serine/threonine protein kinase/dipeptidyl aminopeptidase/acylaminoacyl peptidase